MSQQQQNDETQKAPRGFLGTIADLMKSKNEQRFAVRRTGGSGGVVGRRPQPKKPCGGCGGK